MTVRAIELRPRINSAGFAFFFYIVRFEENAAGNFAVE
jgi:hypothetical protein